MKQAAAAQLSQASCVSGTDVDVICVNRGHHGSWTHLLGPVELLGVFTEQVEGLRRALPLVHVACDEDALHAHLQLPGALPPLAVVSGRVPLLAPLPRVAGGGGHVGGCCSGES